MSFAIKFTLTAEQDLADIVSYLYQQTKDIAITTNFLKKLQNEIRNLDEFPQSGMIPHNRVLMGLGYRYLIHDNYLIFYKIEEGKESVIITAVLHANQDYVKVIRRRI